MDEVVITISGVKHWLWRAVDQTGMALDILVRSRRDTKAAKRLLREPMKKQTRPPCVMITDKLASYGAARRNVSSPPMAGSATSSCSAAIKCPPPSIEPPGSRPFRFGPMSPALPLRRNHEHAALVLRHRDLSATS